MGQTCIVLNGGIITENEMKLVAEWLNQDQNTNAANSEMQLLDTVRSECMQYTGKMVKTTTITSKIIQESMVKLAPSAVHTMVSLCMDMGVTAYPLELLMHHSNFVDQTEISISVNFIEEMLRTIAKRNVIFRLNVIINQYDADHVEKKLRPQPDVGRFFSIADLNSLAKPEKEPIVDLCETFMRGNRELLEVELAKRTTPSQATTMLKWLETNVVRFAANKELHKMFGIPGVTGKCEGSAMGDVHVGLVRL